LALLSTFHYHSLPPFSCKHDRVAELVDAALHEGTELNMSAAFKVRTGSNPVPVTLYSVDYSPAIFRPP
jgi:hypothetical protein